MSQQAEEALQEPLLLRRSLSSDDDNNNSDAANAGVRRRNIRLTLWYTGLRCAGEAIWFYSVWSAYIYMLRPDHPAMIGYLSALEGVTQFIAATVAGALADRWGKRDVFLQVASVVGLVASTLTFCSSFHYYHHHDDGNGNGGLYWYYILVAQSLYGVFDGIGLTVSLALFADSITVEEGQRSHYFTQRTILMTLGAIVGPMGGLIMFALLGNTWTIPDCSTVICIAQVLLFPAFVLMCFFKEYHHPDDRNAEQQQQLLLESSGGEQQDDEPNDNTREEESEVEPANEDQVLRWGMTKSRYIAVCAAASDVIGAFASGLSFRYFAIFLLTHLHLGPVLVLILDALKCLSASGLLKAAHHAAVVKNQNDERCRVSILFKGTGAVLLVIMIVLYKTTSHHGNDDDDSIATVWLVLICTLYVLQDGFLGSTGALTRSLVMDHVPRQERAKWSALESINIFGWCGSAAVGGVLVQHVFDGNVLPVFGLTAALQVAGLIPLMTLVGVDTATTETTERSIEVLQQPSEPQQGEDQVEKNCE